MTDFTLTPFGVFHPFPRLPKEIRDQVWAHATAEPRVLNIRAVPPEYSPTEYFFSSAPVPAILQTCHESRTHALKFYARAFAIGSKPRYIWTNFEVDTIEIGEIDLSKVSEEEKARFRRLRVDVQEEEGEFFYGYRYPRDYEAMKRLRSLVIMSGRKLFDWAPILFSIRDDFKRWGGRLDDESWTDIDVKFVEIASRLELSYQNYDEIVGQIGAARSLLDWRRNQRLREIEYAR